MPHRRPHNKRGVFCADCARKIPTESYSGQPPAACPSCASTAPPLRWCAECEQMCSVPVEIKARGLRCRACIVRRSREYERTDPGRRAQRESYRKTNREQINARARQRYASDDELRERAIQRSRVWAARNRKRARAKSREYYRQHSAQHRAAMRRWQEANPEKVTVYRRTSYRRLMADPKRRAHARAQAREAERMRRRLTAELKGKPIPPVPLDVYRERYGTGTQSRTVDTAPLRELITEAQAKDETLTEATLAFLCQVSARRLYGVMHDPRVSIAVADRICVGLGMTFSLVYPEAA